ncbi:hypothetical protein RTCIAT899_PC00765 (plasmid) [Rhizobium tropici CIAT 899]|nr:hypothetical protein RTCIAT899_PC00765 [Rhizobium tropici CIAT 899]
MLVSLWVAGCLLWSAHADSQMHGASFEVAYQIELTGDGLFQQRMPF